MASLKPTLALCLEYCTVHVLRVLIAVPALFEGTRPLILAKHACGSKNSLNGRESYIEGESVTCQLHFRSARETEKSASGQGSLNFQDVSNSFWEGTSLDSRPNSRFYIGPSEN